MKKIIVVALFLSLFAGSGLVFAEEPDSSLDNVVARMKTELHLSDEQTVEVKNIFEDSMAKFEDFKASQEGQIVLDKEGARNTVQKIKDEEKVNLSKVLSADQMKEWARRQRIREHLNKEQLDFSESQGGGLGAVNY